MKQQFSNAVYELWKSYLNSRPSYVKVKDSGSTIYFINAGVSQGNILGTVLCTLYTSDIPTIRTSIIYTFTDDTGIVATQKYLEEEADILQNVQLLKKWLNEWRIKVNCNKCNHIIFTLHKLNISKITLYNNEIPQKR